MNIRHYLVREQTWVNPADAFYWLIPERTEVVATFANYEGALADCRRREEEARWPVNPFRYGNTMFYRSSLDAPRLHDWLLDHDIEPPVRTDERDPTPIEWEEWWSQNVGTLSDSERATVWEAMDKVRFFDVVDEPARTKAYVIVQIQFTSDDENDIEADPEGGSIQIAFYERSKADWHCRLRNAERQAAQYDTESDDYIDYVDRIGKLNGEQMAINEAIYFEVLEVPLEPGSQTPATRRGLKSKSLYLVTRACIGDAGYTIDQNGANNSSRVPLKAFANRDDAIAYRAELERRAWRTVNPFHLACGESNWAFAALFDVDDDRMPNGDDRLPNGMNEQQIVLALQKLGLNAPRPVDRYDSGDWVGWWDATAPLLSDEQFAEIWDIFSGFRLFEVADVQVG